MLHFRWIITLRKTARFHKQKHSNSLSLPVTRSCVVVLKSIMKHFIKGDKCDIYKWHLKHRSLKAFSHSDPSYLRIHPSVPPSPYTNPSWILRSSVNVLKDQTKNIRRVTDHWKKTGIWFDIMTFLYMHYLHTDSHSEVFEVPQSPPLHTYINR